MQQETKTDKTGLLLLSSDEIFFTDQIRSLRSLYFWALVLFNLFQNHWKSYWLCLFIHTFQMWQYCPRSFLWPHLDIDLPSYSKTFMVNSFLGVTGVSETMWTTFTTSSEKQIDRDKTTRYTSVAGYVLCNGTNLQRKQREMRIISQLGTVQPYGLNINFSFIWTITSQAV